MYPIYIRHFVVFSTFYIYSHALQHVNAKVSRPVQLKHTLGVLLQATMFYLNILSV